DADGAAGPDLGAEPLRQKADQGVGFPTARAVLHAGVHVLDVLPEDHDVETLRLTHRARNALEVAHRADAGIQVEQLAQGHVEGPDPAAHRGRERALDGDAVRPDAVERGVGQPASRLLEGLFTGEHFQPLDATLAAGGLVDRRVEHAARRAPDVGSRAVSLDERNDGVVRHHPASIPEVDPLAHRTTLLEGISGVCQRYGGWSLPAPAGVAPGETTPVH